MIFVFGKSNVTFHYTYFAIEDFGIKIFYFVREVMICYLLTADQSQARTGAC